MPKVSVIVPIYKVEKYIEKCARSLMEQTLDEIEIIFVNDCTPDHSIDVLLRVVKDYPNRKNQVRIINNSTNQGVSFSRLVGIDNATGEYICFVDSDDWVELNMYELMYAAAKESNADIVVSNYYNELRNSTIDTIFNPSRNSIECLSRLYKKNTFPYTLWCQMYRKKLFASEQRIKIEPTNHAEDLWLNIYAHVLSNKTIFVSEKLYHYNQTNVDSMVKNFGKKYELFCRQKHNLDNIANLLFSVGGKNMATSVNNLYFHFKHEYRSAFKDERDWFDYYRISHRDILMYGQYPMLIRLKMWIIYSNFHIWRLYCKFLSSKS